MADNVRKGISQAELTESGSNWLMVEVFVVCLIIGFSTFNLLAFFVSLLVFYFMLRIPKTRIALIYVFNTIWTLLGIFIGLVIGSISGGVIGMIIGAPVLGILAFIITTNVHHNALTWFKDVEYRHKV